MRLLLLLIPVSMILGSSCTIQKRSFRNGYYISWHKSGPKEKPGSKEQPAETKTESLAGSTTSTDTLIVCKEEPNPAEDLAVIEKPDSLQPMDSLLTEETQPTKRSAERYSEKALLERLSEAVESIKDGRTDDEIEEEDTPPQKKLNLFSLNAAVLATGFVVFLFVALFGGQMPVPVIVFSGILSLVFSIVGMIVWARNRTKFWGTFFSVLALILLVAGFLTAILAFIASLSFS